MKIRFIQTDTPEIEVDIRSGEHDQQIQALERHLQGFEKHLIGELDQYQHKIPLRSVFYLESVDKKVFFYTEHQTFRIQERLLQLEQRLSGDGFVRVSKSCLINLRVLKQIKSLSNSRMEAVLINDEKIIVSRSYLANVRKGLTERALK